MKAIICVIFPLLLFAACKSDKAETGAAAAEADTVRAEADTIPADSVVADPPRAADGLFDDFVYSFMHNARFQRERVVFPLHNYTDGKDAPIAEKDWRFDRLYSRQDVYTLIFDSERSVKAEKDTSLRHVVVEWVYLDKRRVKQYVFDKLDGLWKLTAIERHALEKNVNADFYDFYARFSTSPSYQAAHIRNPFSFKTYDSDGFQTIEGVLDVEQWPDYCPALPAHTITNINYGQSYGDKRRRVLMICSQSGGMGCLLVFERTGNSWRLTRLEN